MRIFDIKCVLLLHSFLQQLRKIVIFMKFFEYMKLNIILRKRKLNCFLSKNFTFNESCVSNVALFLMSKSEKMDELVCFGSSTLCLGGIKSISWIEWGMFGHFEIKIHTPELYKSCIYTQLLVFVSVIFT